MKLPTSDWIELRDLHETSLAKSMYVWFIAVPVLANIFSKIEIEEIKIPFYSEEFNFLLTLPFSWWVLYLGALLVVVSNVSYNVWCPSILKDHKTFKSFLDDQKEMEHLIEYRDKAFGKVETFEAGWEDSQFENTDIENLKQKFWKLHRRGKLSNPIQRHFSTACFFGALGCMAVVAIQNLINVMRQLW